MQALIRFIVGGLVVMVATMLGQSTPFLSGILSGFPAVFFTTLVFIYWSSRKQAVISYTSTALWGIIGGTICVVSTGIAAAMGWAWPLVIVFGLAVYSLFVITAVYLSKRQQVSNLG